MNKSFFLVILLGLPSHPYAQQRVEPVDTHAATASTRQLPTSVMTGGTTTPKSDYILGPGDQISVIVPDLDDQFTTDRLFRIDVGGDVTLPFVGQLHAAGLSSQAFSEEVEAGLRGKILKHPQVIVNVAEFHSQPVSVLGEVNAPGLHQVLGEKNLFEALSAAGGFADDLGNTITITREIKWGRIPLPNAHDDQTGQYSVASLLVTTIIKASDPAENIPVMPDDVITVSKTEVVYAVGSVNKPGGFQLGEKENLSSLQVLSLAEGLTRTAAPARAIILRLTPGSKSRVQLPVDIKKLLAGNGMDIALQADDILFIPSSKAKSFSYKTIDIMAVASGAAIYKF